MTQPNNLDESKKLSLEKEYQDQLTEAVDFFSELMRKKAEFYRSASKDGFTSEEIENMFPPHLRGTYEDILDRMLPEGARRNVNRTK